MTPQRYRYLLQIQNKLNRSGRFLGKRTIMHVSDLKSGTKLYRKPVAGEAVQDNNWYQVVIWRDDTVTLLPQNSRGSKGIPAPTAKFSTERVLTEFQLEKPWETPTPVPVEEKKKIQLDKPVTAPTPKEKPANEESKNEAGK
jgi:hypothetical protein